MTRSEACEGDAMTLRLLPQRRLWSKRSCTGRAGPLAAPRKIESPAAMTEGCEGDAGLKRPAHNPNHRNSKQTPPRNVRMTKLAFSSSSRYGRETRKYFYLCQHIYFVQCNSAPGYILSNVTVRLRK